MYEGRLISFARDLVRIPSLSGQEKQVARRVEYEMKALAFDQVWQDDVGNVVGVWEGKEPGPTLVFDAHTDTVGISPGVPWALDPHSGEVMDGALHGRGSADMKGALAAMVYAVSRLDRATLRGKAVVSASVLEEVLEGVALERVIAQTGADFVVIGEASDLHLVRGGRGRAEIHLKTIGRPSHSSAPHLGRNAVLDMLRVVDAVEALPLPEDPLIGPAILALTDIISDPYPGHSVIPSICKATYDRRLLPGENRDDVLNPIIEHPDLLNVELEAKIGVGEYDTHTGYHFRTEKFFPAWLLSEEEPLIERSRKALTSIGLPSETRAYRFCTNAAYSAGVAGIPTLGFGPANERVAHQIDEKLGLSDLLDAARGYAAIAQELLS